MTIPLVLIDDDHSMLTALKQYLGAYDDMKVIFTATSVAQTKMFLEERTEGDRKCPTTYLIDYYLRGPVNTDGRTLGHEILAREPNALLLLFSAAVNENLTPALKNEGFKGFVRKKIAEEIVEAIRLVNNGESYWHYPPVL